MSFLFVYWEIFSHLLLSPFAKKVLPALMQTAL